MSKIITKKYIVIIKTIKFVIRTLTEYLIKKNDIYYSTREREKKFPLNINFSKKNGE